MVAVEIMRPRFTGVRFDEGRIPLDVLSGVAGLNRFLVEVSRWHLRQASGNLSARIPRGFDDSFRMTLSGLESGSAAPVISMEGRSP